MNNYKKHNAESVLKKLEKLIEAGKPVEIINVYDELSIFDWWVKTLTVSMMKRMCAFLKDAIRLGFIGYVCFKVGASGCSNGMWAHREESTNGHSPECDVLFRSFTPDYTEWNAKINGEWISDVYKKPYKSCKTVKELEKLLERK